jgi:hypothetical protein
MHLVSDAPYVGCEVPVFIFKHVDDGVEMIDNDIMWGQIDY